LTGLAQGGCARFALDLTECVLMDSTFLGVLAGFALRMNELNSHSPDHVVELLNPNARVSELLENLGVLHLFRIVTGPAYEPMADTVEALASEKPDSETLTRTSLEAHETLMGIDPENVPKFKDVTKFLAEDLKRFKPNA
jgi:anti-anti-sigma regulatory factor